MKTLLSNGVIFLFLLMLVDMASASCPKGYSAKTNGCYKVYQVTEETSQADAQKQCQNDDISSNLASVRSIEDNDFYASKFPSGTKIWIGLKRDEPNHPVWIYIADGQAVQNQGCYKYDRNNTDFKEMALQSPPGGVTYQTCIDYCQSKSGSNYAYAAVTGTSGNFQCGCAAEDFSKDEQFDPGTHPGDPGCIQRCDGDNNRCGNAGFMVVLKIGGVGFDQWAYGQTNNFDGYQTCGALITQHNPDKLGDELYSARFPYICHDKYHNFHVYEEYVSWFEARNRCRKTYEGGDLATLRNNTDRDNLPQLGAKAYWTGLINTLWRWPNGDPVLWSSWEPGQPNWKPNTCVTMDTGTKTWRDESCATGLRNFVCEVYDKPTTTTTATTATTLTTGATSNATNPASPVFTTTTTTRTRVSAQTTTTASNGSNPDAGASTGSQNSGLSTLEIVLIVMCILLFILIIILIVLVFYFKKRNNRHNRISHDLRADASVPNTEALREEIYLPSEEMDTNSGGRRDLIQQNGFVPNRKPLPDIKINGDVR